MDCDSNLPSVLFNYIYTQPNLYHTRDCNKINNVRERTEKLLRLSNVVNRRGKIPAIWKMARVVLIPKRFKRKENTIDASCQVDELTETCRRKNMICDRY